MESRRPVLALALVAGLLAACGGGGTSPAPSPPPSGTTPPSALSYPVTPALSRVDEAVAPNVPSASGDPAVAWSVAPALPTGITFDPATGALSGTPLAESAQADYVVTASNDGGAASVTLPLAVGPRLPAAFASLAA